MILLYRRRVSANQLSTQSIAINGFQWEIWNETALLLSISDFHLMHTFLFVLRHPHRESYESKTISLGYWQTTLDLQQFYFQFLLRYVFLWRQFPFLSYLLSSSLFIACGFILFYCLCVQRINYARLCVDTWRKGRRGDETQRGKLIVNCPAITSCSDYYYTLSNSTWPATVTPQQYNW